MYKVYYRYNVRVDGCGCCSYSANELCIERLDNGTVIEDTDEAPTFCFESELADHLLNVYAIEKDEIVVDKGNEYL
jgi:hypothetical protein